MEAMAQSLQKIYHRASDAIHQGSEGLGEHVLKEIQDICEYSLRIAHEDHRLTVRPGFCAPSRAVTPFIPPKGQRGRPKKRGGYAGGLLAESRKRCLNVPGMFSTSLAMSHSPLSSNFELPSTPQTWDSSPSAPEYPDITDQSAIKLDPEATETSNPIFEALVKIQGICSVALRFSNGNQATLSTQDMVLVGPKTKRCKPRRRGGTSGSFGGGSVGANSQYPYTSGPSSPTPSVSLGPDGSPSVSRDISGQDVEPLVTPFSSYSPLPELQDNLQAEMIELDTITGSREASPSSVHPSVLDLPNVAPITEKPILPTGTEANFLGDTGPLLTESADTAAQSTGEEENGGRMEAFSSMADHRVSEDVPTPIQLDHGDPVNSNKIPPDPIDHNASQHPLQGPNLSPVHPDRDLVETEVKEPDDRPIPDSDIPVPSGCATPAKEDSKPFILQGDTNIPELSSSEHQNPTLHIVSDEVITGAGGKRKGHAIDDSSQKLETVVTLVDPNALGKSALKPSPEGDFQVTQTEPVSVKEDGQKTYKRQRRSAAKLRQ
ncbi:hypothetical protein F511_00341 [Dorcoceras hygrometricum]|nr:hypothetical protein F511_00341 [Dorcoceras hygrometricum]